MIALSGAAVSCDALGPTLFTEPGMHGTKGWFIGPETPVGTWG